MALSDACADFLHSVRESIEQLADAVHYHSAPGNPLQYGGEIDALRRACAGSMDAPFDPNAIARVVHLAHAVMCFHDTPPGAKNDRTEMMRLIRALQKDLDPDEAAQVPAVVEAIIKDTPNTPQAAHRLKAMLAKLGKPAYDVAIKIIGDVASATVKKMLGL